MDENKNPQTPKPPGMPPSQTTPPSALPRRSDVSCMTITVVGAIYVPIFGEDESRQLSAFLGAVEQLLYQHFPEFQPGHPPVTISVVSLPEVRTDDAEGDEGQTPD